MVFNLNLVTTEECNLACNYCYMHNRKTRLTRDMIDKYFCHMTKILMDFRCTDYCVTFFGGEPTLNWDIIEYALEVFNLDTRCKKYLLITNGTLLNADRINWLKTNNINYSISFDGLWNEKNRPFKNRSI